MLAYYILQLIKTPKDSVNKCSIYIAFTELTESCSWEWFPKHLQKFQALDWRHFQRLNEHPGHLGWFLARYAFCGVPLRYTYIYNANLSAIFSFLPKSVYLVLETSFSETSLEMSLFSTYMFSFSSHRIITEKKIFFSVFPIQTSKSSFCLSICLSASDQLTFFFIPEMREESGSLQAPGSPPCLCDFSFTLQISSTIFHCHRSCCPSFLSSCSFLHLFLPEEINSNPIPILDIFHCISFSHTDQVFLSKHHNWYWIHTFL